MSVTGVHAFARALRIHATHAHAHCMCTRTACACGCTRTHGLPHGTPTHGNPFARTVTCCMRLWAAMKHSTPEDPLADRTPPPENANPKFGREGE